MPTAGVIRRTVGAGVIGAAASLIAWPVVAAAAAAPAPATIVAGPFRFAAPVTIPLPDPPNGMVLAHLRSKKQLDIVTSANDGKVSVLLGDGRGRFRTTSYVVNTAFAVGGVAAVDVTGDKRVDIVAAVKDPSGAAGIATLPGNGDGTFGSPIVTSTTVPGAGNQDVPVSIVAGNFLGTGTPSVGVGFSPGGANPAVTRIYPSLGDGHFGTPAATIPTGSTYANAGGVLPFPQGSGAPGLIVIDTNCGFDPGNITLLANDGHGVLTSVFTGVTCPANAVLIPLRTSHRPAIVATMGAVLQTPRHGVVLLPTGSTKFASPIIFDLGATPTTVAEGDLLGQHVADVVAANGKVLEVAHGHGNGVFDPPVAIPYNGANLALHVADVTGDGRADIVALDASAVTVLRNVTPQHNSELSALARALATPADALGSASGVVVGSTLAVGGVMFITFPAELFNRTFDENYAEIRSWWTRLLPRRRRPRTKPQSSGALRRGFAFVVVLLIGALLGGLLDPRFGANTASAENYVATGVALALGVAIPALVTVEFRRRRHKGGPWLLHALPLGLLIGAACVLVSRVTGFQPGYLYGVVAGVVYVKALDRREEGQAVAASSLVRLVVSVIAWCVWLPIRSVADKPGAFAGWVILDDLLAALFVAGLVSTAIGLLPLRFMPGWKLKQWHRGVWAAAFTLALFGVLQILVRSHSAQTHQSSAPLVTTILLFVIFGIGSLIFRDHFARRERRLRGEQLPPLGVRLREIFIDRKPKPVLAATPAPAAPEPTAPVTAPPAEGSTAQIRAWARAHGYTVSDRGRLPVEVLVAWENRNA